MLVLPVFVSVDTSSVVVGRRREAEEPAVANTVSVGTTISVAGACFLFAAAVDPLVREIDVLSPAKFHPSSATPSFLCSLLAETCHLFFDSDMFYVVFD